MTAPFARTFFAFFEGAASLAQEAGAALEEAGFRFRSARGYEEDGSLSALRDWKAASKLAYARMEAAGRVIERTGPGMSRDEDRRAKEAARSRRRRAAKRLAREEAAG